MSLNFKDFFPAVSQPGFFRDTYEDFPTTVARANRWVSESGVKLINIETVLLPNAAGAKNMGKTEMRTSGETGSYWYQIVRIWYVDP